MKLVACIAAGLILQGCCSNLPKEVSLQPLSAPSLPKKEAATLDIPSDSNLRGHFVACNAKYNNKEVQIVDEIVDSAKRSGKPVVLYFHGGLSSQKYMKKTLAPQLMETVFEKDRIGESLYPIFMNYDAGVDLSSLPKAAPTMPPEDDQEADIESFDRLLSTSDKSLIDPNRDGVKSIISVIQSITGTSDKNLTGNYHLLSARALHTLRGTVDTTGAFTEDTYEPSEQDTEYLLSLLEAEKIPPELMKTENFFSASHNKNNLQLLLILQGLEAYSKNKMPLQNAQISASLNEKIKLRILRILARFALKNDHGFIPTIQEEYLDLVFKWAGKSQSLAVSHWNKVKTNAKLCFAEGSNGRAVVKGLLDNNIRINTLAHSAGSIPTAELINYLASRNARSPALDKVVMVVPAINQLVFNKLIVPNARVFRSMDIYPLKENAERKDNVASPWLYSASLLYGVSALGENSKMLDKMLLIEQHLQPERAPYKYKIYRCAACEKPNETWDFLVHDPSGANAKVQLIYYPLEDTQAPPGAATHGGTKQPWISNDLAQNIFKRYGVQNADNVAIPPPKKK